LSLIKHEIFLAMVIKCLAWAEGKERRAALHDWLWGFLPFRFSSKATSRFCGSECFQFIEGDGAVPMIELQEADLAVSLGDYRPPVHIEQTRGTL
jgi:hypothetical protein